MGKWMYCKLAKPLLLEIGKIVDLCGLSTKFPTYVSEFMCLSSQKEEQGDSESSEEEAGSDLEAEDDSDLEDDVGKSFDTILSPCCNPIFPSEKYPASSFLLHMRVPGMLCKYPLGVA